MLRYLPPHTYSALAAASLEEAREIGRYDEALDVLLENQPIWGAREKPKADLIAGYLESLGVDARALERHYVIPKQLRKLEKDKADAAVWE